MNILMYKNLAYSLHITELYASQDNNSEESDPLKKVRMLIALTLGTFF